MNLLLALTLGFGQPICPGPDSPTAEAYARLEVLSQLAGEILAKLDRQKPSLPRRPAAQ